MTDAIILLVTFSILYLFIIEIFTLLFRFTGLNEKKSRFQVISLLTACGFTTSQSELITSSEKRKQLAFVTMMFGYIFNVIIVSVVANMFVQMTNSNVNTFIGVGLTLSGIFVILVFLIKSKITLLFFDNLADMIYTKVLKKTISNTSILDVIGDKVIASIRLTSLPELLREKALKDVALSQKYGIRLLVITRNKKALDIVNGDTILELNDTIVVFGHEHDINTLFDNI